MKIWFQNRRTKWKKQDNISNAEAAEHKVQASKSGGKREKAGSSNRNKNKSGVTLTTSECSMSITESMDGDSSEEQSNPSPMTQDDLMSDEGPERGKTPIMSLLDAHPLTKPNHCSSIISNNSSHQTSPPLTPELCSLPPTEEFKNQSLELPTTGSRPSSSESPQVSKEPRLTSSNVHTLSNEVIQAHPNAERTDLSLLFVSKERDSPTQLHPDPIS